MAKHNRMSEDKQKVKKRPRPGVSVSSPADRQVEAIGLGQLPAEPMKVVGGSTVETQSARLSDRRLQGAQRRALFTQIGQRQGNRHLQRVVLAQDREERINSPSVNRGKPKAIDPVHAFVATALKRHLSFIAGQRARIGRAIMPVEEPVTETDEITRQAIPAYLHSAMAARHADGAQYKRAAQSFGRTYGNDILTRFQSKMGEPGQRIKIRQDAPLQQVRRFTRVSTPHPTGIAATKAGTKLNYGAVYTHTFTSSTGKAADLKGVVVGEHVTVSRDDFGLGWGGVPLGTITAPINASGKMNDQIGTPAGAIHGAMPRVKSLPAVLETPQTLHWKDSGGSWNKFTSVGITFTVRRRSGKLEAVTTDNGVSAVETFTGPAPGGGSGP